MHALKPIKGVENLKMPALFIHGNEDNFVLPHHSKEICEKYGGSSKLILVDGDHNSARPKYCLDSIGIFLY